MIASRTPPLAGKTGRPELLLICGSSLTVIAILCIVTFLLIREHANAQESATRSATTIAQLIDADVLRTVELYDLTLQGLIAAAQRDDLRDVTPQIRHLALFDRSTTARFKGDILLLDKHGDVVADSSRIEPKPGNFADRDYFLAHAFNRDTGMFISRPFKTRCDCDEANQWRISFSRRISSDTGEFAGVAVASMKLDYFDQLFNSLDIGKDSTLNIINSDGVLLAQKPYLQSDSIGKSFGNRPNVVRILGDKDGSGSFTSTSSMDHQQRLYTYSRVGNLPLTVMVALSSDEVFGTWRRTALLISGATGVLCAGLLWLTWLLARELRLRQRAERELAQLAATDALTGVANRRMLDQSLRHEWFRAQRSGKPLSVMMIDADHFKAFNDRHGHQAGDQALRELARVITANVRRPGDLVARYGGEEFSVILAETDGHGAQQIAGHIRQAVEQLPLVDGAERPMTVSIGISTWTAASEMTLEQLLFAADKALYQAKEGGRNRIVVAG
ncbi:MULTISPECIES: sensor domain-containing diguanylate cyclase [unclassified Pseudomonas]|uniref:sensor domain-containing diguanylate cyclase n=1 Tax=unclassified Pseudomonas TaxID=196821 RepID=UPI000CD3036C|nr:MULTISPECIES: sensor domain-containing diguanylate cyclase [unclassified Pseudomonas]POA22184.1 deoxyribonuclease [Pseudomonas sp. FW305-3-2-15-E-TSA4]POA43876.1 deoxyribonuclease [Pseudomonas sp. FW305-3-2-15-E-TSA2]